MDRPVTHPNFREDCPPKFNTGQLDHAIILLIDHSHTQIVKLSSISKSTLIHKKKTERHFDLQTTKVHYYYCRYSATSAFININQNNICC